MIYTVTFNPALDYVVRVEHVTLGAVNRRALRGMRLRGE